MKHLVALASMALLLLGAGGAHEWTLGKRAMDESNLAFARGQTRAATVSARRAAEAVVPGSPYPARAYARIEAIATAAEADGRLDDAAFAWRAMRSAAEATRPAPASAAHVEEADLGILRIAGLKRARSTDPPGASDETLRRELQAGEPPSPLLPMALGWAALGGLAILLVRRGGIRSKPVLLPGSDPS